MRQHATRRSPLLLPAALLLLMAGGGCGHETHDMLKGKWQLKTVEQAGTTATVDTVWYNFQSESIFMYQIYSAARDTFAHQYGFKTHPGGERTLLLELISYPIPLDRFLPATDWEERTRAFTIESVTRNRLVLAGEGKIYSFEKF